MPPTTRSGLLVMLLVSMMFALTTVYSPAGSALMR